VWVKRQWLKINPNINQLQPTSASNDICRPKHHILAQNGWACHDTVASIL
jgi:hypothetical protein